MTGREGEKGTLSLTLSLPLPLPHTHSHSLSLSFSHSLSRRSPAGRCSVFGGGAFSHRCSRRHRSPAGVAVRYRSRAAVVVGSARASGGACRPHGTLFFWWLHYCTAASAFSLRSQRGPRDTHAHDPRKNRTNVFASPTLHGGQSRS